MNTANEPIHILVVEDDDALRDAVCFTLEMAGHRVTGVNGGPPALEAIARNVFNLVISDLRMDDDGYDGYAFARSYRRARLQADGTL